MASTSLSYDQLSLLLDQLPKDIYTMHIRGEVHAKLTGVVTDSEFTVDRWPDVKALVVRSNPMLVHPGINILSVFAEDQDALEVLLRKLEVANWSAYTVFICVAETNKPIILKALERENVELKEEIYQMMTVTKESLTVSSIPDGFMIKPLHPAQAPIVNSLWKFSIGQPSETYIKNMIEKLPSCCLYNREGDVVGFALRYHYGAIGMLHVLGQYRGKGYAKVIMSHLADSCLQNDMDVFVLLEEDNSVSFNLHKSLGFVHVSKERFYNLVKN